MPESEMDEILDFASVLMKLVLILLAVLMAGSLVVAPDRVLATAPSMLMLVVPLFALVTLLDLAGVVRRFTRRRAARKSQCHWSHD
jgi:Mg2+/Co2+ transporter CorB